MEQRSLRGADARLLKGYAPLAGMVALLMAAVLFVPTVAREREVGGGSLTGEPGALGDQEVGGRSGRAGVRSGEVVSGGGKATACPDRDKQIPGDPYSPPCIAFSGGNGGNTSRGVTKDSIRISLRQTGDPDFSQTLAKLAGAEITETAGDLERTFDGLVEYFNKQFQFYGRKLEFVRFQGQGTLTNEILGGGQDAANADAIKAAQENVFADIVSFTPPYADALVKQKVIALGAPYMSRKWYADRAPYAWSITPDGSFLVESVSDMANKMLFRRPAKWAGGDLKDKPRKIAIIAPDNPWYQESVADGRKILAAAGNKATLELSYTLDIASFQNQAASLVGKLIDGEITTILCGCDPIFPVLLTGKAREQGYVPEWVVTGTALTDTDLIGQLMNQEEWSHAFGISYLGPIPPRRSTLGYNAYKAVRSDEPSIAVDIVYFQLYFLAVGIQMAGPDLTPRTYESGMFAYPGGFGLAGTAKYGPGKYTPWSDAQILWWDPDRTSIYNGRKGAYVSDGKRYRPGEFPTGDPPVFNE